jgi:hypothetical protein
LALSRKHAPQIQGKKVGIVVSGGKVTIETNRRALCASEPW